VTQEEYEQIEGELALHWKNNSTSPDFQVAFNEWEYPIQSSIRANAIAQAWSRSRYRDALLCGWDALGGLFHGLHPVVWPKDDSKRAKFFWRHQQVDMKKAGDEKRGFEIDRDTLAQAATSYLASPDSQTNQMDWLLLDVLVFAEIESGAVSFKENMTALAARVAESVAEGNDFKYAVWRVVFFAVGIFFNFVAMPLGAYYLAQNGHENFALGVFGLWILLLIWGIATYPLRWRARRKFWKAYKSLQMVYYLLGESTISPRKLKEALDAATALGCHFDGAVFTIVDRITARDPTAFIPSKSG
jgi:hypothetical protein